MAKMSKAERKALKEQQKNEKKNTQPVQIEERNLGYDADFYVSSDGIEIECVRIDFVRKPDWYNDMFISGDIHYRRNELQAKCSDGQWHAGKDIKSCLAKNASDGTVLLLTDEDLANSGWTMTATSSSGIHF